MSRKTIIKHNKGRTKVTVTRSLSKREAKQLLSALPETTVMRIHQMTASGYAYKDDIAFSVKITLLENQWYLQLIQCFIKQH
jgi:hypothetical protein